MPEAASQIEKDAHLDIPVEEKLLQKGLPAVAISKLKGWMRLHAKKGWLFMLEAKDLKPTAITGYRIQKLFRGQKARLQEPHSQTALALPQTQETQPAPVENEELYLAKIKEDPKNLYNYCQLAKFYAQKNNFADAADLYQYLVKHEPGNAEYQSKLAYCHYRLGHYEKAAKHYELAIGLDSTQPNRYYNLGVSLDLQGKTEAAIKAFEQAITLEQKNGRYYLSLASAYQKVGDKNRAKMILRQARKFDPGNTEIEEKLKQFS